jgi:hypothetical protein
MTWIDIPVRAVEFGRHSRPGEGSVAGSECQQGRCDQFMPLTLTQYFPSARSGESRSSFKFQPNISYQQTIVTSKRLDLSGLLPAPFETSLGSEKAEQLADDSHIDATFRQFPGRKAKLRGEFIRHRSVSWLVDLLGQKTHKVRSSIIGHTKSGEGNHGLNVQMRKGKG